MAHDLPHTGGSPRRQGHERQSTVMAEGAGARPRARVFVVEDNPVVLRCFMASLREIGVTVVGHAQDEQAATDWLQAHPDDWNVAIVDVMLARGTGLGVLRTVLARSNAQKVLMVTNYMSAEMRCQSFALGANGVFNKSTQLPQMMALVEAL